MSIFYECTDIECGWQGNDTYDGDCPCCGKRVGKTPDAEELDNEPLWLEETDDDG